MNKTFEQFKAEQEIRRVPENTKMGVVGILVLSVIVFTFIGDENVKPIIWYWATFMSALVAFCIVQDIIAHRKIKKLRR